MAQNSTFSETDLYEPLRVYLTAQGYTVRSEVAHCDIAATRGDDLLIIEMKRSLSLALIAQAVERQAITDAVYVAIPRPADVTRWRGQTRGVFKVLRRLELGLILVAPDPDLPVEVVFHPLPSERRRNRRATRAVLQEMARRSGDFNAGGSCRRKLVTAYREQAIHVACCLAEHGPLSPRALRALGAGPKTLAILARNVYGWFERVNRGVYALTACGQEELALYPELTARYRRLAGGENSGSN